jgi:Protein of unknown function (DUF3309)
VRYPPVAGATRRDRRGDRQKSETAVSLGIILIVVLLLVVVGALPRWPHSTNWGYFPSGTLGIVLVIVVLLVVLGRI